jgi:ribulose 1,5-bisphosphate synthetase/thiazole synthase
MELACALCLEAIRAGAVLLNLLTLEDVCIHEGRVTGVVVNRTTLSGTLPVDPIVLAAGVVIDTSGHDAVAVERLRSRSLLHSSPTEPRPGEVYPGLWVAGMSVCATFGGTRMGPIFGGMLRSGERAAELILAAGQKKLT